jgi:PAS domain S-box-containing protein
VFRDLDNVNLHKDGSLRHIQTNGRPILAPDGTLLGYRGLDRDVTEKKQAERELREAKEQMRALVNTIPDLIWLKDADGHYLACNPRFEQFLGATEAGIIGKTDYDFVPRELADFFRANDLAASKAGGPLVNEEEVIFASDGHREILQTIKTPFHARDGQRIGVLGIARDISDRKAAEEELRQRNAELERFNRATVGREIDMIAMKVQINSLSQELGRAPPYPLEFLKKTDTST